MARWWKFGGRPCPACGARMSVQIVTRHVSSPKREPVVYYGVRHHVCPRGCKTALYDFSRATPDPEGGPRGWRLHPDAPGGLAYSDFGRWLGTVDLGFVLTVIGLVVGYLFLAVVLFAAPGAPVKKIVLAVLLMLATFYVATVAAPRPRRGRRRAGGRQALQAGGQEARAEERRSA